MFFIVLLFLLLFLYLIFICPNLARRKMMEPFFHTEFAHRGLFSDARAIPENSMKAFQEAVRQHVGIELDVHLTKDEKVVVFHDDTLTRMCQIDALIEETLPESHIGKNSASLRCVVVRQRSCSAFDRIKTSYKKHQTLS